MMKRYNTIIGIVVAVLLFSCKKAPDYWEEALRFAGANRPPAWRNVQIMNWIARRSEDATPSRGFKTPPYL